jgi:hypothetical protein
MERECVASDTINQDNGGVLQVDAVLVVHGHLR